MFSGITTPRPTVPPRGTGTLPRPPKILISPPSYSNILLLSLSTPHHLSLLLHSWIERRQRGSRQAARREMARGFRGDKCVLATVRDPQVMAVNCDPPDPGYRVGEGGYRGGAAPSRDWRSPRGLRHSQTASHQSFDTHCHGSPLPVSRRRDSLLCHAARWRYSGLLSGSPLAPGSLALWLSPGWHAQQSPPST